MSDIFDSYHVGDFLAGGALSYGFTQAANEKLEVFVKTLDEFHEALPRGLSDADILQLPGWDLVLKSAADFLDSSVDWLEQNCSEFLMMKWSWTGHSFGSDHWGNPSGSAQDDVGSE